MLAVSHMHSHAVGFTAETSTGKILYQGSNWNEPEPTLYDPPLDLPAGTAINWTCNYQNDTGRNITFGESATLLPLVLLPDETLPVTSTW